VVTIFQPLVVEVELALSAVTVVVMSVVLEVLALQAL
jgi:hypothetical protein